MERANKKRNKKNNKARKAPKVPLKTYHWEEVRRSRRRGGYPWTYLYKRPYSDKIDPYSFTMDALRRSKSASTMGARSDGVDISEVSSFAESGKTTPSFLNPEFITEPPEDISAKHSRAGSEVIEEYMTEDEKDLEDDVQIKEFRTGSVASSDNISQYLDKDERYPGNSNSNQENGNDDDKTKGRDKRAKSEETGKRKRKLSAESSYSRYSLSRLGVMKKLRNAKSKITDATNKIKVPKVSFPTKKILRKSTSPTREAKNEDISPKGAEKEAKKVAKKEAKKSLEPSRLRKTDKPVYIHIPLKPPPGETDEFSHLEFEPKTVNGQNGLSINKISDNNDQENDKTKLNTDDKAENDKSEKMDVAESKIEGDKKEDDRGDVKQDESIDDKGSKKQRSPFSSLERGPRVTKKPPLKINPAFKQFLKDVRELKDKEIEDIPKETQSGVDEEESIKSTMKNIDTHLESKEKETKPLKLDNEEQLDLEEQLTSDIESSPTEDVFDKLFEARASKKEEVPLKLTKKENNEEASSSRNVRSRSAEPQRKRKSSIDSSYSRKSLSKLGIIKKLKEASEKIKGAFSLSSLKRRDSKKEKDGKGKESKDNVSKENGTKDDDKENKAKKHKRTAQEKISQLGKPKNTEPMYIHIPLKPPLGETDEFSHLEDDSAAIVLPEPKKEERTDSLDSMSPVSTKNDDIQFIFLTPPSDDEILDDKEPDIPETPSSDDNSPVFFGSLKKLAERVVDQISPETKRNSLETVCEESDKGSAGEMELNGKKDAIKDTPLPNKEELQSPKDPVETKTEHVEETPSHTPEDAIPKMDETSQTVEAEKMIVDVEDGLNEPPKTEELKSVLKTSSSESTSPVLKKKVSFKRKTKPTKIKTDSDNGYEIIEAPKEQIVSLLEKVDVAGDNDGKKDIKESVITPQTEEQGKKTFLVGDISQSMSMDEEKGYLDQKIVKDTSLEEDYNKWSESGDHEYEPINPPDEVTVMTSSILPGVTVIDTDNEPRVVISATEIFDKPIEEKKKSFFQFGRFSREKVQDDFGKGQGHGGSSDDRSRSSQGREMPDIEEQPRASEGPNKFQVALRHRTDQLKTKTNELRNKMRNIKRPNLRMPKTPEFKKPEFKKPDFKKFKFEKPKINLHLPKIPDTATIHLPGAKKSTITRTTVETRQYSTESNAGDSGSTKQRSKFDFDFSRTFPRFKKKKQADDHNGAFGTTPRAKKNKDVEKRTTESSSSSIRIPLHSEDSMDAEDRLNYEKENEAIRTGYEDRETSVDIDRASRMRFDNDIAIEDEYERENQEINRAEYLNRWQHGNLTQLERDMVDPDEGSNEDERIVEQMVEQRFKKVGSGYGEEKQQEPRYERYEGNYRETLEDRLRRDEDRPRYSEDEEEFERRLTQNKEPITDLDNLEDEEGMQIRDGYSSEGSVSLQRKGRLGKLDIDSDEFFVVHEIREGFQTPANALAQMNEYDPIGSNRSLPPAPSKRKPIKKPKRKKTPHVSQEKIPGDEESVDGVMLPARPKRKSKKNKKKTEVDDGIVPYQKTIHLEHEDLPHGERLEFPRESLGILGDDERDDHEFEMYENEKMQGKEQPEIMITDPYKQFQIMEQQMSARENVAAKASEPSAPPRRHRSLKSLTQSENDSILTDKYEARYREPTNIEDYIIPAHQIDAPPSRPYRRSRSHGSSLSRVSLPPSTRDTDSLLADEAFLTENQLIPSYLIENQHYRQQYTGNQATPTYPGEEQPIQPCAEEPCIQDMRDYMGYSIVDKSRQREPPLPPPRTPPRRRKRQIDPEQKFSTVPRNVGSSQPETSLPIRPLRNYSTLSQVKSSRKDSSHYENDKENRDNEIDIGQYIEIEEDLNRDLISGDVVQKMRQRPLPAPPRPPRKTKTTRRSLQDITSKENIMPSSSSPHDLKPLHIEEETVSTQTEPLPPDFVCEEIRQEPTDTIITPRISEKAESTTRKRDISEPTAEQQTQKFEDTEQQIRRELITPTVYSYEETVTHGSLLVEPLNGAKVIPDHQLSRERLVPISRDYSDEEPSEVPESFGRLRSPEEVKGDQKSQKSSVDVLRTDKLQVSDLDVDRLRVNELLASKIVVSEIDSSSIFANDIQGKSGTLKVGEIELPPRFLEEIVRKLEEIRPSEIHSGGQRLYEASDEEKKTPITENFPQSVKPIKKESSVEPSVVDPSLLPVDPISRDDAVDPSSDYFSKRFPIVEHLEEQRESTEFSLDAEQQEILNRYQHELSPEPPVPPPRSYNLEDTPPDAPPRTLRRKSKDSPRTTDSQRTDQSETTFNPEKTDNCPQPQEMLEPDIDDQPPPRPPEPLEGLYIPSQPPASFYALRAKQYVGLESENIPTIPRRKRHQRSRSRPLSRSRSTSDDSSVTPSRPHSTLQSPRSTRRFSEPSIPELSGRLIQACGSRINNSLKRLIYYLTENILRNADGKQDLHVFMIILLVLIAGLILLGYGEDKTVVHLHHWEYFNPPKDL